MQSHFQVREGCTWEEATGILPKEVAACVSVVRVPGQPGLGRHFWGFKKITIVEVVSDYGGAVEVEIHRLIFKPSLPAEEWSLEMRCFFWFLLTESCSLSCVS